MVRILVATDDPGMAGLLAVNLEKRGFATVSCHLAASTQGGLAPMGCQIAIIDGPPGRDIESVLPPAAASAIPSIVLSDASPSKKRLTQLGACAHVRKPFSVETLVETVKQVTETQGLA